MPEWKSSKENYYFQIVLISVFMGLFLIGCGDDNGTNSNEPIPSTFDVYVDVNTGDDSNSGSRTSPYKTITKALADAQAHDTIKVAPGLYDTSTGEVFPIVIPDSVTLLGDTGTNKAIGPDTVHITGVGDYGGSHGATFVGGNGSLISGFYVVQPTAFSLQFCIVSEDDNFAIVNNSFVSDYGIIRLLGTGDPVIKDNTLDSRVYGIYSGCTGSPLIWDNDFIDGSYIHSDVGNPQITNNVFTGNAYRAISIYTGTSRIDSNTFNGIYDFSGLRIQSAASPIVRNNTFIVSGGYCIEIFNTAQPDLGTVNDSGHNVFGGSSGQSIYMESPMVVEAVGNSWQTDPPDCGNEIVITSSGKVVLGTGAQDTCYLVK